VFLSLIVSTNSATKVIQLPVKKWMELISLNLL
jgi:hypothetical protein